MYVYDDVDTRIAYILFLSSTLKLAVRKLELRDYEFTKWIY